MQKKKPFPDILLGCAHNIIRKFVWPEQVMINTKKCDKLSFTSGQLFKLVCPHGCVDMVISIDSHKPKVSITNKKQVLKKKAIKYDYK